MLEYNTARNKLIIREYGRNIQKMIEDAVKIQDREKRNETARAIVKAMSFATPATSSNGNGDGNGNANANNIRAQKERESIDYWQKLWDHLFIISDYRLDVDSPFPKPQRLEKKVFSIPHETYKKGTVRIRSYGRYLEKIIQTVSTYPDGPEKQQLAINIANQMKRLYLKFNCDTVDNIVIINQLKDLSKGKLILPEDFELHSAKDLLAGTSQLSVKSSKSKRKKKKKRKQQPVVMV